MYIVNRQFFEVRALGPNLGTFQLPHHVNEGMVMASDTKVEADFQTDDSDSCALARYILWASLKFYKPHRTICSTKYI